VLGVPSSVPKRILAEASVGHKGTLRVGQLVSRLDPFAENLTSDY
jgi:hypothetical protein